MNHRRPYRPGCSRLATPWLPSTDDLDRELEMPLPVAGVDRIEDAAVALALIDSFASDPSAHETLVILLDAEHRGTTIVNIDGTTEHDSVLRVADYVTERAHGADDVSAAIIATFRPGGSDELDDLERWLTIDEQLAMVGVELVEWFVIGRSVSCPRSLLGDPTRWTP